MTRATRALAAVFLLLGLVSGRAGAADALFPPGFSVKFEDERFVQYATWSEPSDGVRKLDDGRVRAELRDLGEGQWELRLTLSGQGAKSISFPWMRDRLQLGESLQDDVFLYPYLMGKVIRGDRGEWAWGGNTYPGTLFAPLQVMADSDEAVLQAAVNWPPLRCRPMHSRWRMMIEYEGPFLAGQEIVRKALVVRVAAGSAGAGPPWQRALEPYRVWLTARMKEAGLRRMDDPDWMHAIDGWINVQLENGVTFDARTLQRDWANWRSTFGWMQVWGQMSDYADPRITDEKAKAEIGCCLDRPMIHARYLPELPTLLRQFASEGRVGVYTRPRDPFRRLDGTDDPDGDRAFLAGWLRANREQLGTNAAYIDVLARRDFGAPLEVARWLQDSVPEGAVLEGVMDVYPWAGLVSGCLTGGDAKARPGPVIGELNGEPLREMFPALGRCLFPERTIFAGECNGDHVVCGREAGYWGERQAFLLGARFDAISIGERGHEPPINRVLGLAVEARRRVDWWNRRPQYRHRAGLGDLPRDADVRRFVDAAGRTLLAVSRSRPGTEATIQLDGKPVVLPAGEILIVEPERDGP